MAQASGRMSGHTASIVGGGSIGASRFRWRLSRLFMAHIYCTITGAVLITYKIRLWWHVSFYKTSRSLPRSLPKTHSYAIFHDRLILLTYRNVFIENSIIYTTPWKCIKNYSEPLFAVLNARISHKWTTSHEKSVSIVCLFAKNVHHVLNHA